MHILCRVNGPFKFSDFIRDFKRHTSKQLIENIINEPESRREWLLQKFKSAGENLKDPQEIMKQRWTLLKMLIQLFVKRYREIYGKRWAEN